MQLPSLVHGWLGKASTCQMVLAGSRWAPFSHCLMKKLRVGQSTTTGSSVTWHLLVKRPMCVVGGQGFFSFQLLELVLFLSSCWGRKNIYSCSNQELLTLHRGSRALNHSTGLISGLILALSSWLSKLSLALTPLKLLLHIYTFIVLF